MIRAIALALKPPHALPTIPNPLPILGKLLLVVMLLLLSTTYLPRHGGPAVCDPPGSVCRP
jgi:hypothetical protein